MGVNLYLLISSGGGVDEILFNLFVCFIPYYVKRFAESLELLVSCKIKFNQVCNKKILDKGIFFSKIVGLLS